ncbi:MAG: ATP synthase I [Alphaproteobacteria bacterium]|jgi:ATP synthase protein I|nr:ATP synthase I [Alphaproteobacteria bacterium]
MADKNSKYISIAMRVGVEFISGILIGTLIGRGIDLYFESHPWGLVIFIILGIMAGSLNVYRLLVKNWDETGEK